ADKGVFDEPSDIFFLTVDEVCSGRWHQAAEQVAFRRGRQREYEKCGIPAEWKGTPAAAPLDEGDVTERLVIDGVGASSGVAEGRVRVLRDPGETLIEPGEILVAH